MVCEAGPLKWGLGGIPDKVNYYQLSAGVVEW